MTIGIDPKLLANQAADTRDVIRFKQKMDGLKERLASGNENKEKELRKACQDFEAVFISKLWQGMKKTVSKEGYLHSKQEEQYVSMFDKDFAENMSRAGGIGLADIIYDQLSQKLKETSRDALSGGVDIKPLSGDPVALKKPEPMPLETKKELTLEEWGGSASQSPSTDTVLEKEVDSMAASRVSTENVLSDSDVRGQLEALARRLEAQRIKSQLLGSVDHGQPADREGKEQVGRKIAKIG